MKLLLAILAGSAAATTDVFLASDRLTASAAVLNSVCDNSDPTQLRLHLLAPTKEAAETLARETEPACAGAAVVPYGLAEFEARVRTLGEEPMWTTNLAKVSRDAKSPYAVPVARWDRDAKHTSPYNHARFYAPQLIDGETLVMLDDDVIVQGDVTTLTTQHKAVAAGCQQWFVKEDAFASSTNLSYADVPYFGYGVLSAARGDPACAGAHATECVPGDARDWFAEVARTDAAVLRRASWPNFLRRLAAAKDAFTTAPDAGDAFVDELHAARAWNFGLVVIDLAAWKDHRLTSKYQGWLEANARREFWPSDSLAFGLGLPFLALRGEVECFEDSGNVRFEQGLGVAPWSHTDRDAKTLDDAFALHWNGNRKPWDLKQCDDETRPYFLRYLARSPRFYGDHVAACAPPPPKPSREAWRRHLAERTQGTGAAKASVAGSAFATWDDAYAWYENVYKFTAPASMVDGYQESDWPSMVWCPASEAPSNTALTIDECEAQCAALWPESGRGVLACPKSDLERNVLKWLWWHPGAYGFVGNYRGTSESDPFDGCPRGASLTGDGTAAVAGDAAATLATFAPDNGGTCEIEERCAILVQNDWVFDKETWGQGESWEITDRWNTGYINFYDKLEDKSCGTGAYALPGKDVEENDKGKGTKTTYSYRRSVCLCEDAYADASYDAADFLATSPGLPLGATALPCDDMILTDVEKYDKTTSAEALAIVFIILIVVGLVVVLIACVCAIRPALHNRRRTTRLAQQYPPAPPSSVQPQVYAPQQYPPPTGHVVQGGPQPGYVPQPGYPPQHAPQPGYVTQAPPMATGTVMGTVVQGNYGAPPPGGYGAPPPRGYGAPPPGGYAPQPEGYARE